MAAVTCENCGAGFTRVKRSMRFCSHRCQRAALAKQDRQARALFKAALKILAGTNDHFVINRPPPSRGESWGAA